MYSLYKNTHRIPEPTIAALFSTGFLSGAISAAFMGVMADRFGRKRLCLSYCVIYSLSSLSVFSSNLALMFVGRALGGLGTTLLLTMFESWMIAEYQRLGFVQSSCPLSTVYGNMSTANGLTAILCGLIAETLVHLSGSEKAPFVASITCLVSSGTYISMYWVLLLKIALPILS